MRKGFLAQIIIIKEGKAAVKPVAYPSDSGRESVYQYLKIIIHKYLP